MYEYPKYIKEYKGNSIYRSFKGMYSTCNGLKADTLQGIKNLINSKSF